MLRAIARFLESPANWTGLAVATSAILLEIGGWIAAPAIVLAGVGYAAGFGAGGLAFGWPKPHADRTLDLLAPPATRDDGDARAAMTRALGNMRTLLDELPADRLSTDLSARVGTLCSALEHLLDHWERGRGALSLEDGFHARHIATSYLPEALRTYLAIPPGYAATRALADGRTAEQSLRDTLTALEAKVRELTEALTRRDAEAFLAHSRFLHEKFGPKESIR